MGGAYFDDDSESRAVVRGLLAAGVSAVRATEVRMRGQPDHEHLSYAAAHRLVLVTANRGDFLRLHGEWMALGRAHSGIIIVPQQRYSPGEIVRRLARVLSSLSLEEFENRVEFLSNWE